MAETHIIEPTDHAASGLITPAGFPAFYRRVANLRFPLDVAEVLELRSLINHSTDHAVEPTVTPDYRDFREKLLTEMGALDINRDHHRERLLRVLTLLRALHYHHSLTSREAEVRIRVGLTDNQKARTQSLSHGKLCLFLMTVGGLLWFGLPEPHWTIKLVTAGGAWLAWDYFRSLPELDKEVVRLNQELNEVLRQRIAAVDWKTVVDKLSLILGLRQHSGVEVFRMDTDTIPPGGLDAYH
jgi:hypothetical protein